MRHSTTHTTQTFSVSGGGDRPASHGADKNLGSGLLTKGAVTLIAVLFVATTAGAIAASSRTRAVTPELWKQQTPAFVLSLPGGFGVVEALY